MMNEIVVLLKMKPSEDDSKKAYSIKSFDVLTRQNRPFATLMAEAGYGREV